MVKQLNMKKLSILTLIVLSFACEKRQEALVEYQEAKEIPKPQYSLGADDTHNRWSNTIEPKLRVPNGAVIEVMTEEASDQQLNINSTSENVANVSFDPIHPITGPVFVEGAEPGDVLAVTLHKIEVGDWGWSGIFPGFGYLADEFDEAYLKTFALDNESNTIDFNEKIKLPLRPFPGVMGVAPPTDSLLSTIPPRANGGNMDDPNLVEGTTVYFPVFEKGALFSIGDTHAVQGLGEVSGTAIEAPMRIIYEVNVIKGKKYLQEPQYETDDYYAVTGFGTTIDAATKKAIQYMVDYLEAEHGLERKDAYMLCSLAGDLHIAEVVDVPNMLVTMHMSKEVLGVK